VGLPQAVGPPFEAIIPILNLARVAGHPFFKTYGHTLQKFNNKEKKPSKVFSMYFYKIIP
jgi:hypothetical protein